MVLEVTAVGLQCLRRWVRVVVESGSFDVFHDDPSMLSNYKFGMKNGSGAKTNRGGWEAEVVSLSKYVWALV
jgi:hypothetical protein